MASLTHEYEFEQALGNGEGQRSLLCCSPWGRKESDMTERLNSNKMTEQKEAQLKNFRCLNLKFLYFENSKN